MRKIHVQLLPLAALTISCGTILAITLLAPPDVASEALTGTSVLALLIQATLRSVVSRDVAP